MRLSGFSPPSVRTAQTRLEIQNYQPQYNALPMANSSPSPQFGRLDKLDPLVLIIFAFFATAFGITAVENFGTRPQPPQSIVESTGKKGLEQERKDLEARLKALQEAEKQLKP